jgi:hypothetical protein
MLTEAGLLLPERLAELPDVGAIEGVMLSGAPEWREARRTFQSWAHNTQVSQIFFARKAPQKP